MLDMEKNYKLAGYIWSFVKVDKNHAVIQSHGVTAGPWPAFKIHYYRLLFLLYRYHYI